MKNLFIFFLISSLGINAQESVNSDLFLQLKKNDSLIFEVGFNNCDLKTLATLLTEDLEFYHDTGGIQNRDQFLKAMLDNICSSPERKPIRKLVPNSLVVYPMFDNGVLYGAIQQGAHEFYLKEPGIELYKTGSALFSILWIRKDTIWLAKRIYSYHHAPQ
jgi:hypothetical protein